METGTTAEERFDQLSSVLMAHPEVQRQDAVASLFLRLRVDLSTLAGPARELFDAFLGRALAGRETSADVLGAVVAYFEQHPLPSAISRAIERAVTEQRVDLPIGAGSFARFTGSKPALPNKGGQGGPGGIQSGPLARFQLTGSRTRST
jgi:hypothetical protein